MATQELLPLEGNKSQVCKHFGFPAKNGEIIEKKDRKNVACKRFFITTKFSGYTTNLRFHLKEHHRSACESLPTDKSSKQSTSTSQSTIFQAMNATQKFLLLHPSGIGLKMLCTIL